MRTILVSILAIAAFITFAQSAVAEPILLLKTGTADNASIVYVDNDVCYWRHNGSNFVAKLENNRINLYFEDQKILSFIGLNESFVIAITYDTDGSETSRTKADAGSTIYKICRVIFDYYKKS